MRERVRALKNGAVQYRLHVLSVVCHWHVSTDIYGLFLRRRMGFRGERQTNFLLSFFKIPLSNRTTETIIIRLSEPCSDVWKCIKEIYVRI